MTADEIGVMLNLRATLSEYEHFMSQLSLMIERGIDIPLHGTLSFPMKDRLYKQVRDLVLGKSAMDSPIKPLVGDPNSPKILRDLEAVAKAMEKEEPFVNLLRVGDRVCWAANRNRKGVVTGEAMDGSGKLLVKWDDGLTVGFEPNELLWDDGK